MERSEEGRGEVRKRRLPAPYAYRAHKQNLPAQKKLSYPFTPAHDQRVKQLKGSSNPCIASTKRGRGREARQLRWQWHAGTASKGWTCTMDREEEASRNGDGSGGKSRTREAG